MGFFVVAFLGFAGGAGFLLEATFDVLLPLAVSMAAFFVAGNFVDAAPLTATFLAVLAALTAVSAALAAVFLVDPAAAAVALAANLAARAARVSDPGSVGINVPVQLAVYVAVTVQEVLFVFGSLRTDGDVQSDGP